MTEKRTTRGTNGTPGVHSKFDFRNRVDGPSIAPVNEIETESGLPRIGSTMTEKRTSENAPVDYTAALAAALVDRGAAHRAVNAATAHLITGRVLALHPDAKRLVFSASRASGLSNPQPVLVSINGELDKCLAYQFNREGEPDFYLFNAVDVFARNFGAPDSEHSVLNRRSDGQYILNLADFA